ncbi:LEF-5 [Adoxophyes orana nucleopolyhedrovirus]|uniref:LEF-5 n=1 Tax=Adoxophyes orana nucleopolyhedrovirus TaxID=542343 RepID=UPI0001829C17|nr:LEF-5 [Adoxophyes orana nucleopolyhedrovirus]ACF05364.1 LEF-5 [Adoxophyes orana nucleopolyhedrovirus]
MFQHGPQTFHCYSLFLIFKTFREKKNYNELIEFLIENFPSNVKNKTFDFINTGHLFHSLYAYIPSINNHFKERKQIRLSEECIKKLFDNTRNDIEMYQEIFHMIQQQKLFFECPCQVLTKRKDEIKEYVHMLDQKKFDTKPIKLKKEFIDVIMSKYSLEWKNILLKKQINDISCKDGTNVERKKRKIKKRTVLNDKKIYFNQHTTNKLNNINGITVDVCKHEFVTEEKQTRAGDEIVTFIRYCHKCNQQQNI